MFEASSGHNYKESRKVKKVLLLLSLKVVTCFLDSLSFTEGGGPTFLFGMGFQTSAIGKDKDGIFLLFSASPPQWESFLKTL